MNAINSAAIEADAEHFSTPNARASATVPTKAPKKRKRRFLGCPPPVENPRQEIVEIDGLPAMRVELSGRHGLRKSFLIDPEDWHRATHEIGERWTVQRSLTRNRKDGTPLLWVVSGAFMRGNRHAHQNCPRGKVTLARFVMGLTLRAQTVQYRNHNPLDLRRANLCVVTKGARLATVDARSDGAS